MSSVYPNQPESGVPPAYQNAPPAAQPQPMGGTVVVGQQPATNVTIVQQAQPVRPASYLALAIVTTIFCNLVFGKFHLLP